jgi:16S rRNA (cytosine1402-N4)-methyltransferase
MAAIFRRLGEERWAKRVAQRIVRVRAQKPIETSLELAEIVTAAIPARFRQKQRIHPATRVFMALRMVVNKELDRLKTLMEVVPELLAPGGRFCVLSFHSLEDRMVKKTFRQWCQGCICPPDMPVCGCGRTPMFSLLTPKVVRPDAAEIIANPMARSTRLRAVEKNRGSA